MAVENRNNEKLERLGFSYERGGVHTARTMMLAELRALLSFVGVADAAKADYLEAIQAANCRGKTWALTFRNSELDLWITASINETKPKALE